MTIRALTNDSTPHSRGPELPTAIGTKPACDPANAGPSAYSQVERLLQTRAIS